MERKLSFEEYFHMQMAKRKEKRPLVRNYTDALQTCKLTIEHHLYTVYCVTTRTFNEPIK